MDKVLSGSSRASIQFVLAHWQGLLKISLVPLLIIMAIAWYQVLGMGAMFEFIATQAQLGDKMAPERALQFFSSMSTFYAVGLVSVAVFVWLFVRIVRFWKNGVGEMFGITEGELGSTFMTILYGLGMVLLTMLVYVVGIIAIALIGGFGALIFGNSSLAVIGTLALVLVAIGAIVGLLVFMYRFLVGLPGVALGEVPGFFSDIWPLAKGESFGLPLRIILWTIVAAIPILIVTFAYQVPLMSDIEQQLKTQAIPNVTPEMMSQIFRTMAPLQMINLILQIPLIWFVSVLLSEAHFRFRKKLSG
jgi:hypothetical protein